MEELESGGGTGIRWRNRKPLIMGRLNASNNCQLTAVFRCGPGVLNAWVAVYGKTPSGDRRMLPCRTVHTAGMDREVQSTPKSRLVVSIPVETFWCGVNQLLRSCDFAVNRLLRSCDFAVNGLLRLCDFAVNGLLRLCDFAVNRLQRLCDFAVKVLQNSGSQKWGCLC